MIVVMQCAGSKNVGAGCMLAADGRRVLFVAHPEAAPRDDFIYAHPDDTSDRGVPWRTLLLRYNETPHRNPHGLFKAFELYKNNVYRRLAMHVGVENLFILSAGWGLIPASFLTPSYDITFSAEKRHSYKRRRRSDSFRDFQMLPSDTRSQLVFLGSKRYLPQFLSLTTHINAPKTVLYRSDVPPEAPGCRLIRYQTDRRTNWHYECADALIGGHVEFDFAAYR
jgi:hypothetical protein